MWFCDTCKNKQKNFTSASSGDSARTVEAADVFLADMREAEALFESGDEAAAQTSADQAFAKIMGER